MIVFRRSVSTASIFSPQKALKPKELQRLTTTELLSKLGYIKQPHAGLTHWLPLGLTTLNLVESLVRAKLNAGGIVETSLSALSHNSLWQKTNRWQNNELFKVNADFCLAATAEEEITDLVKDYATNYKKLPFIVYQITRKYRDERRARGGLLRGREFVMKDAYSFDTDRKGALASFDKLNQIYYDIFSTLKVPFIRANADSGSIGGDLSYEWHFLSDKGEDTLFTCDNCHSTSNIEKVRPLTGEKPADEASVQYFLTPKKELVAIYYPAGRKLCMKFVDEADLVDLDTKTTEESAVLSIFKSENQDGFKRIIRLMDAGVQPGTRLPDMPVKFERSNMTTFEDLDLTQAQENDLCPSCEKGHLHSSTGIEVGHTFYLGKKYSEPLEATFVDENGDNAYYEMGCYGIGISRLLGSVAEVLRDEQGLRWPAAIAPLQVSLIRSPSLAADMAYGDEAHALIDDLTAAGIRVEQDESDSYLGDKLNKSKQLGIPLQVVIGKDFPLVEIEVRGKVGGNRTAKLRESNGEQWEWQEVEKRGVKKELVPIEHAAEVIVSLLSDM